jgi:prepilin-type N-terminal cleavage/methylation domain-containing protein
LLSSDPPKDGFAVANRRAELIRRGGTSEKGHRSPFSTSYFVISTSQRERLSAFTLLSNFRSPVSGLRSPVSKFSISYFVISPSQRQRRSAFTLPKLRERFAFTLLEILVVIAIIAILMVLIAPAFTSIKTGNDVTTAAYTIKGVLDQARTYAMANNTYTWVGFSEENGSNPSSPNSDVPATGRVVISIVASTDGTMMYTAPLATLVTLPPANLIQLGKLTKIDNFHLKTFPAPTATPPPDTFDTRPAVSSTAAQIGDTAPPSPLLRFQYPLGSTAKYTFAKVVQFSPRGEGVIDNSNYTFAAVSEIGLQPAHGSTPDAASANLVAIQFTGMAGNVKIYRR